MSPKRTATSTTFHVGERPAIRIAMDAYPHPLGDLELAKINTRTAYYRSKHVIGDMAVDADQIVALDPEPFRLYVGLDCDVPTNRRAATASPAGESWYGRFEWEPRTHAELRAAGLLPEVTS